MTVRRHCTHDIHICILVSSFRSDIFQTFDFSYHIRIGIMPVWKINDRHSISLIWIEFPAKKYIFYNIENLHQRQNMCKLVEKEK
jgi:hypothetical protein